MDVGDFLRGAELKVVVAVSDEKTPRDLAAIISATHAPSNGRRGMTHAARAQLMPSHIPGARQRVSIFDLTLRMRKAGYSWPEASVRDGVLTFERLGFALRGEGGFAVSDWEAMKTYAAGVEHVIAQ